jgi:ribonucleotide monophosphatase NagD (HAD superfamily)
MGKPQTLGIAQIAASWGVGPRAIAAVGDRLDTDIASAKSFGALGVLVLTGISTRAEAEQATGSNKPDIILTNLTELPAALEHLG